MMRTESPTNSVKNNSFGISVLQIESLIRREKQKVEKIVRDFARRYEIDLAL